MEYHEDGLTRGAAVVDVWEARVLGVDAAVRGAFEANQTRYRIDGYGRTVALRDANVNAETPPSLSLLRDGRATRVVWDDEHNVTALIEPNGATSRWTYWPGTKVPKEQQDAQSVADGGASSKISLDKIEVPLTLTFPGNLTQAVSVPVRRIQDTTDPHGHTTDFLYTDASRPTWLTGIKTPRGNTTTLAYNPDGTVKSETNARSFTTSYAYAPPAGTRNVGFPTKVTPPSGLAPTELTYDNIGAVTRSAQVSGGTTVATDVVYDVFGRPTTLKEPGAQAGQRVTTTVYDVNDNVTSTSVASQAGTPTQTTTSVYLPDDQVRTKTLPANNLGSRVVRHSYDPTGALVRIWNPRATGTAPTARLSSIPALPATASAAVDHVTYLAYDRIGQTVGTVTRVPDQDGVTQAAKTTFAYDEVGNLVSVIDPRKNRTAATDFTRRTVYDLAHRPVAEIDALGNTTRTRYDDGGLVREILDQRGTPTTYDYDADDQLLETTVQHRAGELWTTGYGYDAVGNRTSTTRPDGKVEQVKYDAHNRAVEATSAGGAGEAVHQFYDFDDLGRMSRQYLPTFSATKPAVEESTRFDYYPSGEIKTSTDPWSITTDYEYDQLGGQTSRTFTGAGSSGGDTSRFMTWQYYADGSLKSRSDTPSTAVTLVDNESNTDTGDTQVTRTGTWNTTPTGTSQAVGRSYLVNTGAATVTWKLTPTRTGTHALSVSCPTSGGSGSYSVTHQGTTTTSSLSCGSSQWASLGSRFLTADQPVTVKLTVAAGATVPADAVRAIHTPASAPPPRTYTYSYDLDGNQTLVSDTSTRESTDRYPVRSYASRYDQIGQLLGVDELDASGLTALRTTSYRYDLAGNTTQSVTARGDRLESNQAGGSETIAGQSRTTTYQWDPRNLLEQVNATVSADGSNQRSWRYTYDARGLVTTWQKPSDTSGTPNGTLTRFGYYDNGLLRSSVERKPNDDLVASHEITYTKNGDRATDDSTLRSGSATGARLLRQKATYEYTPNRRIAKVIKTGKQAGKDETYTYDASGNILEQTIGGDAGQTPSGGEQTTYTYERDRLMTVTAGGATARYHYDPYGRTSTVTSNGTLINRYTYDGFDRVIGRYTFDGVEKTNQTTVFDPLDRMVSRTTDGTTKRFAYLGLTEQVAAEQKLDGTRWSNVKTFTYAPNGKPLALVTSPIGGQTETRYYSLNPHGDTEVLTTPDGGTAATYRYTAYGQLDDKGTTGDDAPDADGESPEDPLNPLQYQAQWLDGATGAIDAGFRDYDPGLNRFATRDMYNGALSDFALGTDPWNSNRYAFTGGNPISFTDLDGHIVEGGNGLTYNTHTKETYCTGACASSSESGGSPDGGGGSTSIPSGSNDDEYSDEGWFTPRTVIVDNILSEETETGFPYQLLSFLSYRDYIDAAEYAVDGDFENAGRSALEGAPSTAASETSKQLAARYGEYGKHSKRTPLGTAFKGVLKPLAKVFGAPVALGATGLDYGLNPDPVEYWVLSDPPVPGQPLELRVDGEGNYLVRYPDYAAIGPEV